MRMGIVASLLLLTATVPATAQVSISISIGSYPNFMVVPGYPVYYAPDVGTNFFFYDGYYWVYQNDNWYSSSWYNGPWEFVDPMYVPIYVLQVPVRYYRRPPPYFRGWQSDRAPRWNDHWGRGWAERRSDWDRPQHEANVAPAPLPDYQRRYSGKDYPRGDEQRTLQQQNYHYHPQNTAARSDTGRPPDERRSEAAQPGVQPRSTYDVKAAKRDQPPRPTPQREQEQQSRPSPQQEQQRAPDRAGAGVAVRKSSEPAHDSEQKQQGDQPAGKGRNQDKGKNEDKDQRDNHDR